MRTPRKLGAYVFQWHSQYWGQTRYRLISCQTWWLLVDNSTPYHSTNFSTRIAILEFSEWDSICYVITFLRWVVASFFSLSSSFKFNFHTFRSKFTWPSPYQENYDLRSGMLLSATVCGRHIFKPTQSFIHSLTSVISYALFMYFPIIVCSFTIESSQLGPIETVEQLLQNSPIFHRAYDNPPTGPISLRSALILSSLLCVSILSIIVILHLQTQN